MDLNKLLEQKRVENKNKQDRSLPSAEVEKILNTVRDLEVTAIVEDVNQPRKEYNKERITALALSIKEKGLIQPIIVRPFGNEFMLIAGHRRYRAFLELGKKTIPAIVKESQLNGKDATELALVENLQREDLNALEIAESLYSLKMIKKVKQKELAAVTGYSEANISKYIQLYKVIQDDPQKETKVKAFGFKRAYQHFCAGEKSTAITKEPSIFLGKTLSLTIRNEKDKEEVTKAINKLSKFINYLEGLL